MNLRRHYVVAAAAAITAIVGTVIFLSDPRASAPGSLPSAKGPIGSVRSISSSDPANISESANRKLPRVTVDITVPASTEELVNALRSILPDSNVHRQRKAMLDLMEHLTPENAPAVRELFKELKQKGIGSDFAWWAFCTRWGEIDATGLIEYFRAHPDDPGLKTAASHMMEGWVSIDDRAARAWLAGNQDSPMFRDALFSYAASLGSRDLDQATNDIFGLGLDKDAMWATVGPLVKNARDRGGFEGIANWFDGLTEPQKKVAFEHAMWAMKDADLETAVNWFTANADKPWRNDIHFHYIAERYAAANPQEAMEWALTLPEDPGRPGVPVGTSTIMQIWTAKDRNAARVFIDQHQDASWWPRAAMAYAQVLSNIDGPAGMAFINGLQPDQRAAVQVQMNGK